MKNSIARLLPVHAARERRALRFYHEQNLVYEAAFAQQMATNQEHVQLKALAQKELANLLNAQNFNAAEAQQMLLIHAELKGAAQAINDRLPELSQQTQASFESSRAARQAYAQKVQTHFKLSEASRRISLQQRRWMELQAEQNVEEEFAAHQSTQPADSGQI